MKEIEQTPSYQFYLDSAVLSSLRQFLELNPEIQSILGPIPQYRLVIDANIAVSDLVHKHKNPQLRQTAIEEVVNSGVIELFAPIWLDNEMVQSTIPQVSKRQKIPEAELHELWISYRKQIKWENKFSDPDAFQTQSGDIKDMPYVALQESISAIAVLSRDKDIEKLGGKQISFDFILSTRSYARAVTYSIGIRLGGSYLMIGSVAALYQLVKGIGTLISRLPDWAKISLLVLAVTAIAYPGSRERILKSLQATGGLLAATWPEIEKAISLASEKQVEADSALRKTEELLGG